MPASVVSSSADAERDRDGDQRPAGRPPPGRRRSVSRSPSRITAATAAGSERDPAVADDDLAVGVRGDPRLVGDQHDGGALLAGGADQQLHHLLAGERVQRAGRLVGEQHLAAGRPAPRASATRCAWPPDSSPERRPLEPVQVEPLEPRRGRRPAPRAGGRRPAAAAARRSPRRSARARAGRTGTRSRTGRGAARCARPRAACRSAGRRTWTSPRVGHQDAGQAVQQRRLAGAARPHHGEDLARARPRRSAPRSAGRLAEGQRARRGASIAAAAVTVIAAPPSASASSRAAVRSIQRRSASRWNRPWSASSASTRSPRALELGQLAHPLQVRGALGVEVVSAGPVRASARARPWRTARSAGAARARPARPATPRPRSTPSSVMT